MKLRTRLRQLIMNYIASDARRERLHRIGAFRRRGRPTVHYFHQVDDPYSHLAVQKLDELQSRYRVIFQPHLVEAPAADAQGDSSRFRTWAIRDARSVAAYYGTSLPADVDDIPAQQVSRAAAHLAGCLGNPAFGIRAVEVGEKLWSGSAIEATGDADGVLKAGNQLRRRLGHYLSATFYFEGEWYWGVDRLLHLEDRLCNLGLSNNPASVCVPRPSAPSIGKRDAGTVTLEYFPSLRSPYTAISFDRTMELVRRTGVQLELRPVMPMVMRGVPLPRTKGFYILADTRREANYYNERFGNIVDPIGEPVRRAFCLYPFIAGQGRGVDYCSEYLKASWVRGIDTTTDEGLREVVERCGISWDEAAAHFDNTDWESMLESNVNDMLAAGLWGVPSFRVSGGALEGEFSCWGQDRLWRVEAEIVKRAY